MNVFFFETTNASPHLETSLELAKKHLEQADNVCYYFLGHSVPYSEFVFDKNRSFFLSCLPERRGAKLLGSRFNFIDPGTLELRKTHIDWELESADTLRSYKYKDYSAGLSALSSLISKLGESKPSIKTNKKILQIIIESGIAIYEFVLHEICEKKPDLVYLFNGRFANNRAILDAAISANVPYLIHERGANKYRYFVQPFMPHDFDHIMRLMLETWICDNSLSKNSVAAKYFEDNRSGKELSWMSFIKGQIESSLPGNLPENKKIVTYFSSSDDEFAAVGDIVKWDRWPDQLSAVRDLLLVIGRNPDLFLIIRLHPHKAKKSPRDLQDWLDLPLPENVRIILPNDPIDTYALVERSDVVVTCGSTVGIESVFWKTPSICMGPSTYSRLNAVYLPTDRDELERMILDDSLFADSEKALPYGYYMATFGEEFVYYQPQLLFSGKFLGINLQSFGICKYIRVIKSLTTHVVRKKINQIFKSAA